MNVRLLLAALAVLAFVGWVGAPAFTEEEPAAEPMDEMHEAWIAMGTPGEHHERIAFLAGNWTATMTYWEPGATEGQTGTGTCTNAWISQTPSACWISISTAMTSPIVASIRRCGHPPSISMSTTAISCWSTM